MPANRLLTRLAAVLGWLILAAPVFAADSTIPGLGVAGAITGTDQFPCVQAAAGPFACTATQAVTFTYSVLSGDCTATGGGAITCTKSSGVTYGALAFKNLASLTADVSGILPVANGGTATATPGLVAGSFIGVAGTWPNQTVTWNGTRTGNTLTFATAFGTLTSGDCASWSAASNIIDAGSPCGTATSVGASFTGGLISVAGSPVTSSGTLAMTVAGNTGGLPFFSSATTWASSATLAANQIVLGGGAATAPATLGSLGTTTTVLHGNAGGAPTFAAVSLTADVSGLLPVANGGTGTASPGITAGTGITLGSSWPTQSVALTTPVAIANGGTGTASPGDVAGTGITASGSWPTQTIALTTPVSVANGGSGTATPSLVAGSNITVTGSWPNQTVASTGGGTLTASGTPSSGQLARWVSSTALKGVNEGVFNVRTAYGAVPDGSTDNATAITNAFTASNLFTDGTPTVYFDCDAGTVICEYNYSGAGISPINPLIPTSIVCAPGVILNYTGSAHAADIGPTGLVASTEQGSRYIISQGCKWEGGASMTAGMYVNTYVLSPYIVDSEFFNFGSQSVATVVYSGNNWMPVISRSLWRDTDGLTKWMVDAHAAQNTTLDFADNKSECATAAGAACSVSTYGMGLWLFSGDIHNNEIKYHYPAIRLSSCTTCGGGTMMRVTNNLLEGNTNGPTPAITFGDPATTGAHITYATLIFGNTFYWPVVTNVPDIGPETASSGVFNLDNATLEGNTFTSAPTGTGVYVNTSQGVNWYIANNRSQAGPLSEVSTPALIDTGYAAQHTLWGLQAYQLSGGALANSLAVFDTNGVNINRGSYHSVSLALWCHDVTGSGTTQTCTTTPTNSNAGTGIGPVIHDEIIYSTTTTNTGALTINVNSSGAVAVRKDSGLALVSGDIIANQDYILTFDGTFWQMAIPPQTNSIAALQLDTGTKTATAVAGAATLNKSSGVITSEALTTAGLASYTLTLTDSKIAATDICSGSIANNTNSAGTPSLGTMAPAAGSLVIVVYNLHAATALNGTLNISFACFKA